MNTHRNLTIKMSGIVLFFAMTIIVMFFGCQKDEMVPSGNQSDANSVSRIDPRGLSLEATRPFEVFRIDHQAGRTVQPAYIVSLMSNGTLTFVGVRNVAHLGRVSWDVNSTTLAKFNKLMSNVDFYKIEDNNVYTPDLPLVITTYHQQKSQTINPDYDYIVKSLVDFNNGYPSELIKLRLSAEKIFDVARLVGPVPEPLILNTPLKD